MQDKIFIDSNIFLYAFTNADKEKQAICKEIILKNAVISSQVINEVSVNLLKKLKLTEEKISEFIKSAFSRYQVVSLSKEVFIAASNLRTNYFFSYYDSVIISAALIGGCNIIYSEDMQHNIIINEILQIKNPFIVT